MNKTIKRILSGIISASMVVGMVILPNIAMAAEDDPVISVTFDDGGDAYELQGGAALADGRNGKALYLDNNTDEDAQYATINASASKFAALNGDYSISVWAKPEINTTWNRIYDLGSGQDNYVFLTVSAGSAPRFAVKKGTEQSVTAQDAITLGEWHSFVMTREGNLTSLYIDGFLAASTSEITFRPSDIGSFTQMYLGKSQWPDPYFKGMIDDLAVYNYALDEDKIHDLAAEAYLAQKKQLIYDNNCFVAETHFTRRGSEMFALCDLPSSMYVTDKTVTDTTASFTLHGYGNSLENLNAYAAEYSGTSLVKVTKAQIDTDSFTGSVSIPYTKENAADTVKLVVWDGIQPVAEAKPEDITATVNVKNYTQNSGAVTAEVYAVGGSASNGAQTLIDDASDTFASLDEKNLTISVPLEKIPSDTSKLIVKLTTPKSSSTETATAATLYRLTYAPVAAPADSDSTTNGAHDPSIVKFPEDDTYYVYSSHHLIFTSEDLINWTKYDFTSINAKTMSPKTYDFITANYANTTMNGTYWAPDVIYNESDLHPYWMYISVSCGLGGRNSVISLVKSDSPLFWADKDAQTVDYGVIYATKQDNEYKTNAIDANIYFDSSDSNKPYFIWGSFWGGIQAAPLTEEGKVQGIDYTSDATILNTSKNFGTSIFTQKSGAAGPEGAWMLEHGDYRYAFTSYGWLGSNYNTRVARSPLSKKFSDGTGTQLADANNTVMGTQYTSGSLSNPTGYKLIGSYRLGDGTMTVTKGTSNYYVERNAGDAHIYYGPGHNSAINIGDESFYVSHIRKDAVEGAAVLQVRKMLFTADGWPVVSPVSYAGEKEQKMPKSMLTGTYDLASVGHTKMDGSAIISDPSNPLCDKNYDLPVLSSKVTLGSDMSITNAENMKIGTWEFNGDHTVTLKFTANGDESKDEYYKSGDTMTMFALYGYDKDEAEPVVALTGTDQNHITQLAKKSAANVYTTTPETISSTTPIVLAKSTGGNPELGFDTNGTAYAGDPAALVDGDTVYMYVGHDTADKEEYKMPEWLCYSSKNMTDWTYEGVVMKATDISWRSNDTSAWASQCVKYGGKYYLYYCTWDKTSSGKQSIGVATSNSPTGPFVDKGSPLVKGSFTTPETSGWNDIDPTVLIDTDSNGVEHRYLAWGNGKYYVCELNEDMISVKDIDGDNQIVMHKDIKEKKIKSLGSNEFREAPWLYKRADKYYLFFAANWREEMAYAMTDNPFTGRYDYIQTIMPPTATSNTNHPAVIDFNGKTYFIYHNGALPHGSGFRRSVCIQELEFDKNGYVKPLTETSIGLDGTASVIKTSDNKFLGHDAFRNSLADSAYPLSVPVTVSDAENEYNTAWEIKPAKADLAFPDVVGGESIDNYVSIQSVDKPGLYISVSNGKVTLTQDADGQQENNMTFKTIEGLDGKNGSVSFESVSEPGKFLTVLNKSLTLSYGNVAADASFTIGAAAAKPEAVVSVAEREDEAKPEADITQDFNTTAATLISATGKSAKTYTSLNGVTLYIGSKDSEDRAEQNFAIQSGGVSGNALVLNAGKYQSNSRGGRMAIYTPAIPDGYTVTAELKTKLVDGSNGAAKLYYNDSIGSIDENKGSVLSGTTDTGLTADGSWHTVKMTITNDEDVYTRVISVDNVEKTTDYVDTFPVFWGTIVNSTGAAVYFDDLTIKTTTASGETPEPVTYEMPEGYTSYYSFDGNLTDSEAADTAVTAGWDGELENGKRITAAKSDAAAFDEAGYRGKAVKFTGNGTDGVKLGKVITSSKYTVSFYTKVNEFTACTAGVFIDADGGTKWVSAPIGYKDNKNLMVWSNDGNYIDLISSFTADENTWYQVTIAANEGTAAMYINGKAVGSGNIANVVDTNTNTYLALNYWDTPFNGLIDEMYIYNGKTLNANQVKALYEVTKVTE